MGSFVFEHQWHLPFDPDVVYAALADVDSYRLWWPQVRRMQRIDDESNHAFVRSLLPYTLHLVLTREVEDRDAGVLRVRIGGDLEGWSQWRVEDDAGATLAHYDQEATVTAPGLGRLVPLARPLLRFNHTLMMRSGEEGLCGWLASRPTT